MHQMKSYVKVVIVLIPCPVVCLKLGFSEYWTNE